MTHRILSHVCALPPTEEGKIRIKKKKKYSFGGEKQGQEITVVTGEVFTWLTLRVFSRSLDLLSLTLRQRNSAR